MRFAHTKAVLDLGWLTLISHGNRPALHFTERANRCMDLAWHASVADAQAEPSLVLHLYG